MARSISALLFVVAPMVAFAAAVFSPSVFSAPARTVIEGPYVGVLPCSDCPGIRTELALERDAATHAPRRYWLREVTLDAKVGKRKHEFTAKAEAKPQEQKAEGQKAEGAEAAAPAAPAVEGGADGSGSIEATLDARSTESMGAWSEQGGSAQHGGQIVIETVNGPRYFARVSERVLEAVSSRNATSNPAANAKSEHRLQLRAGAQTPLSAAVGVAVAGMVSRDAKGRLILAPCSDRAGAYVLTPGGSAVSVDVALEALDFARTGRAFLEVYGRPQGASLQVSRVARASTDLDCTSASPAPVTLSALGGDGAWSMRADVDGIRLVLPAAANKKPIERGSTAQPLAWNWREGRVESASAVLRSGDVTVRAIPRLCRDTMSNTVYGFAAEFTWGKQKFAGCAWSAAPEQP